MADTILHHGRQQMQWQELRSHMPLCEDTQQTVIHKFKLPVFISVTWTKSMLGTVTSVTVSVCPALWFPLNYSKNITVHKHMYIFQWHYNFHSYILLLLQKWDDRFSQWCCWRMKWWHDITTQRFLSSATRVMQMYWWTKNSKKLLITKI